MTFRNMSINITPDNSKYRGEGNASLVIYLKKEEKVLRLPKVEKSSKVSKNLKDARLDLENQIKMIENVMKPLLGKDFVHCPLIVFLCSEELRLINDIVRKYRPVHRIHKNVEETDSYVFMFPDYCCLPLNLSIYPAHGPVICIEIKPKHGYWKEFHSGAQSSLCHFCMMQHYKIKRGVILEKSGYCPSDLFSGCHERMFHALKMLLQTPQNNFRIFKNQEMVYSEEEKNDLKELLSDFFDISEKKRYSDLLCNLIIRALLKPFPQQFNKNILKKRYETLQCANAHYDCSENDSCHELPKNCALGRVLNVQELDNLDIRMLHPLFLELKNYSDKSDHIGCFSRSDLPHFLGEPTKVPDESDYQYCSRKVWEFLIALTMKDCSIMLAMRQLDKNCTAVHQNVISDDDGNVYLFSISIADLDAKPLSKVEKVYKTSMLLESCFD